ncbi:MAG TPA: acyl-CoA desaturase [Polyangia bacterium]|nr:acyl-CoA desaturase [Polyangia bacterium]
MHLVPAPAATIPSPPSIAPASRPSRWSRLAGYVRVTSVAFWGVHVAAVVGVILGGWSWSGVALALVSYYVRMIVVTAGYHRYFAHRAFKTSRGFQFVLAMLAQTAAQKGVLWWASHHRWHHKYSDTPKDIHSAKLQGFWHSHIGWVMAPEWDDTDQSLVGDLAKFPELRFMDRSGWNILPTALLALAFLLIGGGHALVWGYFIPTVLLWHGSFAINSLAHLVGKRRYATTDDSRNSFILALLTTGEGWHNNHHHYQSSANQGFRWWEVDVTYYVLRLLAAVGLVWDLRRPPRHVLEDDGSADAGTRAAA